MNVRWDEMITSEWVRRLKVPAKTNQQEWLDGGLFPLPDTITIIGQIGCYAITTEIIVSETISLTKIKRMESRSNKQDQVCVIGSLFKNNSSQHIYYILYRSPTLPYSPKYHALKIVNPALFTFFNYGQTIGKTSWTTVSV